MAHQQIILKRGHPDGSDSLVDFYGQWLVMGWCESEIEDPDFSDEGELTETLKYFVALTARHRIAVFTARSMLHNGVLTDLDSLDEMEGSYPAILVDRAREALATMSARSDRPGPEIEHLDI